MTLWPEVLADIKDQMVTKSEIEGEYLEQFNIYDTDDVDTVVQTPKLPRVVIVVGPVNTTGSISRKLYHEIGFTFLFGMLADTEIKDVNYVGDKLMMYVLQKHIDFLNTYVPTDITIQIVQKPFPSISQMGEMELEELSDIIHTGHIIWQLTVLNEAM